MIVNEYLAKVSEGIRGYVNNLSINGKFGICQGNVQIKKLSTGCSSVETQCCDRFIVIVPFAGCSLNWEVLFNHQYPNDPPDFIFGSTDEEFCPEIENIKSLVNWDPENAEALVLVLQELLQEYRIYHLGLKDQNSRLQFEFDSLISDSNFLANDIEVHVNRISPYRFGQVNFLMKLPINFGNLPAYLTQDCPGEDTAVLLVTFQAPDSGQCTPQLFLSPRVKRALGDSNDLRIPSFPNQGCLMDYVPTVVELLSNKIKQIVTAYEKRKSFITALLTILGSKLLEYDQESFSKISFLMEWHDFFFTVLVDIPPQFPNRQPDITFQSIYHVTHEDKPYRKTDNDYPYKSNWKPEEMAIYFKTYILDSIPEFQKKSVREGFLQQ